MFLILKKKKIKKFCSLFTRQPSFKTEKKIPSKATMIHIPCNSSNINHWFNPMVVKGCHIIDPCLTILFLHFLPLHFPFSFFFRFTSGACRPDLLSQRLSVFSFSQVQLLRSFCLPFLWQCFLAASPALVAVRFSISRQFIFSSIFFSLYVCF